MFVNTSAALLQLLFSPLRKNVELDRKPYFSVVQRLSNSPPKSLNFSDITEKVDCNNQKRKREFVLKAKKKVTEREGEMTYQELELVSNG